MTSSPTTEEVLWLYRVLLGRDPESRAAQRRVSAAARQPAPADRREPLLLPGRRRAARQHDVAQPAERGGDPALLPRRAVARDRERNGAQPLSRPRAEPVHPGRGAAQLGREDEGVREEGAGGPVPAPRARPHGAWRRQAGAAVRRLCERQCRRSVPGRRARRHHGQVRARRRNVWRRALGGLRLLVGDDGNAQPRTRAAAPA